MADQTLEALLELERRGQLPPDLKRRLAAYRAQGVTKTKPLDPHGRPLPKSTEELEGEKARDAARSALDLIARIQPQLDRVRGLYGSTLKGAGPLQSLREYLPSQANGQFDSAAAQLQKLVRPATRTPGEGAMSDFESKLALQALPDRWSMDGSNEESIRGLQTFLHTSKAQYAKRLGLPTAPPPVRPRHGSDGWTIQETH